MKITVTTRLLDSGNHETEVRADGALVDKLLTRPWETLKQRNQLCERACELVGVTEVEANAIPWGTRTEHGAWGGSGRAPEWVKNNAVQTSKIVLS